MLRLTRRSLWEHKRRLLSTVVAIVLGVGFMAGTLVLTNTIGRTFDDLFATANKAIDAQVQGKVTLSDTFQGDQRALLDPGLVDQVRAVPGVHRATPFIQVLGFGSTNRVIGSDGKAIGQSPGPPTLFQNWITDTTLTPYHLTAGRGPTGDDEIGIDVAAAESGHLRVGDQVHVISQFGRATYRLVGTYTFGDAKSPGGAVAVSFTLPEVERLAGTHGQVQQVLASANPGVSQIELVRRITKVVPKGTEVLTGVDAAKQKSSDVQRGFSFFKTILTVFGGRGAPRGDLRDLEHVRDPRGAAHPRAGPAPRPRRRQGPGAGLGPARGRLRRAPSRPCWACSPASAWPGSSPAPSRPAARTCPPTTSA